MPRLPLLMTATLIGIPSTAQVASSWLVIWKQPSPSIAHTAVSGRPTMGYAVPAAGVEPVARVLVADELRGPHLMLADPGHVHRVRAGHLADPLDHVLRRQRAVVRLGVPQRVGL